MREYKGKTIEIMSMAECPNKCEHCLINYKGHIEFDELEKMIIKYKGKFEEIILNGTELLMDDRYLELCKLNNQDFIYTNGRLLTPEKRKKLKECGITRISISLHYGIQELISKSSLEEISKVITETAQDGFAVRVLCTISKDNYKLIPIIAEYVKSLGATSLKFINMMKEGKAENLDDVFLDEDELKEFFDLLEYTRNKYDSSEFYITRNGGFGNDSLRNNNFECTAGQDIITLTPEHKVYPCNFLIYDEYCIGHWDETGIYIDKEFKHDKKECKALQKQLKKTK